LKRQGKYSRAKGLKEPEFRRLQIRQRSIRRCFITIIDPKRSFFEKVYQFSIVKLIPQIAGLLNEEMPLKAKLRNFTMKYLELIKLNPDIPLFILHEMNKSPRRMKTFMLHEIGKKIQPFLNQIQEEKEKGNTTECL
jgi:TetR/AcrR family transcriptional regulator